LLRQLCRQRPAVPQQPCRSLERFYQHRWRIWCWFGPSRLGISELRRVFWLTAHVTLLLQLTLRTSTPLSTPSLSESATTPTFLSTLRSETIPNSSLRSTPLLPRSIRRSYSLRSSRQSSGTEPISSFSITVMSSSTEWLLRATMVRFSSHTLVVFVLD
jgi:hypothetical protein